MLSSPIVSVITFSSAVYGHGYLSQPMSRTGLNAEVSLSNPLGRPCPNTLPNRLAQILAPSALFSNPSLHGLISMPPKSAVPARAVIMPV